MYGQMMYGEIMYGKSAGFSLVSQIGKNQITQIIGLNNQIESLIKENQLAQMTGFSNQIEGLNNGSNSMEMV